MTRVPFSLTFSGPDSTGLLARIGDALTGLGCELADTRIASLVGLCTGMSVLYAPEGTTRADLERAFEALVVDGLLVTVRDAPDDGWPSHRSPLTQPFMISYEGANRPGLLVTLAHMLSEAGCQFSDVSIDSTVGNRSNAYVLVCEVQAPLELAELRALTRAVGEKHGLELSVIPANLDDILMC